MKKIFPFLIGIVILAAGCAPNQKVLTIMTHDSFSISEEVVAAFETENDVELVFLASGDSGTALNKAILSKKAPLADIFFGVDNTFLSRALEEDIFEPYESPFLAQVPDDMELDPEYRLVPVDDGDVCINYDKYWFAERGIPVPETLTDLLKPDYRGLLVVENPATSSPGLAFLLATIATFGEDGFENFWVALKDNDVVVADGWETAYYTNFSASSGRGPQPMVVSYASSPPFEVVYADPPVSEPATAVIVADGSCFRDRVFIWMDKLDFFCLDLACRTTQRVSAAKALENRAQNERSFLNAQEGYFFLLPISCWRMGMLSIRPKRSFVETGSRERSFTPPSFPISNT